jgi:hypothetical protein
LLISEDINLFVMVLTYQQNYLVQVDAIVGVVVRDNQAALWWNGISIHRRWDVYVSFRNFGKQ